MKTKSKIIMLITCISLFISCAKDGAIGPQGNAGPQGTQGPTGPTGNANVQNYDITVSSWQWTYDDLYEMWYYRYSNSSNMNSAVYAYVISGNGLQAMPFYDCVSSGAWCRQYDMATYLFGSPPYIEFQFRNYISMTTAPTYDTYFYLVIIPPALRLEHPNVDYTNYAEVKKVFKLGEPIKIKSDEVN